MTLFGSFFLLLAFVGALACVICLVVSNVVGAKGREELADSLMYTGSIAGMLCTIALTVCCAILVFCFMTGDTSLLYVVKNQSNDSSAIAWLYKLSGLWAGRQGSLLFWAWLIAVFAFLVGRKVRGEGERIDAMALLVIQVVICAFLAVLLFSTDNMPFEALDSQYLDSSGNLAGEARMWGMNALLEHWAMCIHPPTLFIGYAGMTVPFAYALATLIVGDASDAWVRRSQGYTLFSWLFLGVGIGLGSVWAYVVLGWGGYWGWDPVENASLLPWLVGLALIHSFTMYRKRGQFKRWSVMCACLSFAFVILGTFISRSGLVSSVHAFEGDAVSIVLFLVLVILSVVAGIVGLVARRKLFAQDAEKVAQRQGETQSLASKEIAYYANNLVLVLFAVILAYLTLTSALPEPLPFAGMSISTGTYNALARPVGIIYCLLMAVCPLLAWGKTEGRAFRRQLRVPAIAAVVLFALLLVLYATCLYPHYADAVAQGGSAAAEYTDYGPAWYYNGLAVVGLLVASLLFCTTLMMLGRLVRGGRAAKAKAKAQAGEGAFSDPGKHGLRARLTGIGGMVSHLAMAIILVGLIGSSMFVAETVTYLDYDSETDTVAQDLQIDDYTLVYTGSSVVPLSNGTDVRYDVSFDVYRGESYLGSVTPSIQVVQTTMQQKLNAGVISLPQEDLFVVFQGVSDDAQFIMDVRVNPLIMFVWVGFGLLMLGALVSFAGKLEALRRGNANGA